MSAIMANPVPSGMTQDQKAYITKVGAIATVFMVIGIIIAIKMKKGFWPIVGFAVLGSLAGGGIGRLVLKYPDSEISQWNGVPITY